MLQTKHNRFTDKFLLLLTILLHVTVAFNRNIPHQTPRLLQSYRKLGKFSSNKPSILQGSDNNKHHFVNKGNSFSDNMTPEYFVTKIGSSASTLVAGTFFVILAYKRDAFMVAFFCGAILNGVMSKILKRILDQDRPNDENLMYDDSVTQLRPSDKGMPSSHAMSLGFIGTISVLGLLTSKYLGILSSVAICLYVVVCLWYRVKSKLHSLEQVAVGLFFGVINGIAWRDLIYGSNSLFPFINLEDVISKNLLPATGIMPVTWLIIPAVVGAIVVGSFERRISEWMKSKKDPNCNPSKTD